MNKEYAVASINKIGKIGYVIAKICRIVLMVGAVGSLIGAIVLFALPDDLFVGKVSGTGIVEVNAESMKGRMDGPISDSVFKDFTMDLDSDRYVGEDVVVSPDGMHVTIHVAGGDKVVTPNRLATLCLLAMVYVAASAVLAFFVEKLCKGFRDSETPFAENIITAMERFAWCLIPWALIHTTCTGIMETAFNESMDIHIGLGLSMILAVLLVFGLTRIFKYGAVLQQQADETL